MFCRYEAASASIERYITGGMAIQPGLPTVVLLFSAAIKAGMFVVIRRLAHALRSPTLETTAKDNLSDVLTSCAAFVGVIGSNFWHLLDPLAGILVAVWIFRAAFMAAKENLGFLTGAGADEERRNQILEVAQSVPGVIRVHHLMTEYVGPQLVVDLHINVDGNMPLKDVHHISDMVNEKLSALPDVDRAYVHVEPDDWEE